MRRDHRKRRSADGAASAGVPIGRRSLLAGAGAAALGGLLPGCSLVPPAPPPSTPTATIDVHCHVFNAADLPGTQFAEEVALAHVGFVQAAFGPAVYGATQLLASEAPDAIDEFEAIQKLRDGVSVEALRAEHEAAMREKLLQRLAKGYLTIDEQLIDFFFPAAKAAKANAPDKAAAACDAPVSSNQSSFQGYVTAEWIEMLMNLRFLNVVDLYKLSNPCDRDPQPRLLTPALVDYTHWLCQKRPGKRDCDTPRVAFEDQVAMLREISTVTKLLVPDGTLAVHGFVPFCPRRQVEAHGQALRLATRAVEEDGFVGVKVYPPMGFRPINNREIKAPFFRLFEDDALPDDFGKRLDGAMLELFRWCIAKDVPVFTHCGDSQSNDRTGLMRAAWRGSPRHWLALLEYDDPERPGRFPFRQLRLNLGHFGGIWLVYADALKRLELGAKPKWVDHAPAFETNNFNPVGGVDSPDYAKLSDPEDSLGWVDQIVWMLSRPLDPTRPAGPGNYRYPNLYADLADFGDVSSYWDASDPNNARFLDFRAQAMDWLFSTIIARFDRYSAARDGTPSRAVPRLMYGTDWNLLGRELRTERYHAGMRAAYRHGFGDDTARADRAERALLVDNAYAFLGLRPKTPNRDRLDDFNRRHGLPGAVLRQLDRIVAPD